MSLVLSGKSAGRISAKTEQAVRRAAEELGYRPNMAARALRTGAARSVGPVWSGFLFARLGASAPFLSGAIAAAVSLAIAWTLRRRALAHPPVPEKVEEIVVASS